jgi:hypothetical protein
MRILELGSYLVPAYAGMILAEQGHEVDKWTGSRPDPVLGLRDGHRMWEWVNHGKKITRRDAAAIGDEPPGRFDAVIDNIRETTWRAWGTDPAAQARRLGVRWVSMRDDSGGRSFDAIAQARAWGDHIGYVPAYLGDTAGGLWLAFKLLAAPPGHHVLRQAACLAKLVEGELAAAVPRDGTVTPWDEPGTYGRDDDGVTVVYRGERHHEPFRDDAWRRENLRHDAGRYVI